MHNSVVSGREDWNGNVAVDGVWIKNLSKRWNSERFYAKNIFLMIILNDITFT